MSGQNEVVRVFQANGLMDFENIGIRGNLIIFPLTTCFDFYPRAPRDPAPALQSFGHQVVSQSRNRGAIYMV